MADDERSQTQGGGTTTTKKDGGSGDTIGTSPRVSRTNEAGSKDTIGTKKVIRGKPPKADSPA